MNTSVAILKVTNARRDVILAGGLYHRTAYCTFCASIFNTVGDSCVWFNLTPKYRDQKFEEGGREGVALS